MKLYDKRPLYTNENGIFKRTKKSLYKLTKQGKIAAIAALGLLLLIVLVAL